MHIFSPVGLGQLRAPPPRPVISLGACSTGAWAFGGGPRSGSAAQRADSGGPSEARLSSSCKGGAVAGPPLAVGATQSLSVPLSAVPRGALCVPRLSQRGVGGHLGSALPGRRALPEVTWEVAAVAPVAVVPGSLLEKLGGGPGFVGWVPCT